MMEMDQLRHVSTFAYAALGGPEPFEIVKVSEPDGNNEDWVITCLIKPERIIVVVTIPDHLSISGPALPADWTERSQYAKRQLKPRHYEVLKLCCTGLSSRGIGKYLHLSASTVKRSFREIYNALGIVGDSEDNLGSMKAMAVRWYTILQFSHYWTLTGPDPVSVGCKSIQEGVCNGSH